MPADKNPLERGCWLVTIAYSDQGFVKDDDAAHINFDDLLKRMQASTRENNQILTENGYPTVDLVGWAAPPHYDAATHKLYWAKELKFAGRDHETLNYDVRMLGRRGVLILRAVAQMDRLEEIRQKTPEILSMVNFIEGSRYDDFNPKADKVADYGLAGLVAPGVTPKAAPMSPWSIGLIALATLAGIVAAVRFGVRIGRGGYSIPR
jgi:uncharacterized membrane-anchored protein